MKLQMDLLAELEIFLYQNQSRADAMELIESSKSAIPRNPLWNSILKRASYPLSDEAPSLHKVFIWPSFLPPEPPFIIPSKSFHWHFLTMKCVLAFDVFLTYCCKCCIDNVDSAHSCQSANIDWSCGRFLQNFFWSSSTFNCVELCIQNCVFQCKQEMHQHSCTVYKYQLCAPKEEKYWSFDQNTFQSRTKYETQRKKI